MWLTCKSVQAFWPQIKNNKWSLSSNVFNDSQTGLLTFENRSPKNFLRQQPCQWKHIYKEIDQPVINEHIFWCLQMIELSLGRCIYIYDSHLTKAYAKKTATATACFLLSCFYRDDELVRRSLGGKNGKQCVNTDILRSILSKYNHNLTIILITIIEMFTLHEPVFERAA